MFAAYKVFEVIRYLVMCNCKVTLLLLFYNCILHMAALTIDFVFGNFAFSADCFRSKILMSS